MATKSKKKPLRLKVDRDGRGPLWYAAMNGRVKSVRRYLDAGADPNVGDRERVTPLYIAAYYARLDAVKLLLRHGADPNLVDCNDMGPLQQATYEAGLTTATGRHFAVVDVLLRHGADPDQKNRWRVSPRQFAKDGGPKLRALFARIRPRSGGTRQSRRAPTPDEALGTKDEASVWAMHEKLWDKLVPPRGRAKTLQGEVIRVVGKLTREAYHNGNANWNPSCALLWKLVTRALDDQFPEEVEERGQIKRWIRTIIRDRDCPDVSGEGSPYDSVAAKAVAWVLAHPKPIRYAGDPRIRM